MRQRKLRGGKNVNKATYPALEARTGLRFDDVRRVDANVQTQHQGHAHSLHLEKSTRSHIDFFAYLLTIKKTIPAFSLAFPCTRANFTNFTMSCHNVFSCRRYATYVSVVCHTCQLRRSLVTPGHKSLFCVVCTRTRSFIRQV